MSDSQTDILIEPKYKSPSMYGVVILNDDFSPMEFVIQVLKAVFNIGLNEATVIMLKIHKEGRAKVGYFTYEVADTKAALIVDIAQKNQHPLQAFAEPL